MSAYRAALFGSRPDGAAGCAGCGHDFRRHLDHGRGRCTVTEWRDDKLVKRGYKPMRVQCDCERWAHQPTLI